MTTTSNEVVVLNEGGVTPARNYNRNLAKNVIAIRIRCRKQKAKAGNTFNAVKGLKSMMVINEDGKSEGRKNRWLTMHFTKDAFNDVAVGVDVRNPEQLKTGTLYVEAGCIQSPRIYQVTEDEEGNKVYPTIWIKGGIVGFEAYVASQDEFTPVDEAIEYDVETGEIVEEADDTSETAI